MSTLVQVNAAPYGSDPPSSVGGPTEAFAPGGVVEDELVPGVRPTGIHGLAATVARSGVHRFR